MTGVCVCVCLCVHTCVIVSGVVREGLFDKVIFELGVKGSDEVSQEDRGRMFQAK